MEKLKLLKTKTAAIVAVVTILVSAGLEALGVDILPEELEPIITLIVSLF